MKKIVIIGPSVYGLNNHSDDSMLAVFTRELHANLSDLQIILLARHPNKEFDELYGVKSIRNLDHTSKKDSIGRWFNGLNPGDSKDHLKQISYEIKTSDLVVIGAEPFLEVTTGLYKGPTPYATLMITLAKFYQKPIMIFGIHMGRPFESDFGIESAKFGINNSNLVTIREEFSRKVFLNAGINDENIISLSDPAFGLNPIQDKNLGQRVLDKEQIRFKSDNVLGITFRHLYWKWSPSEWDNYSSILAGVCDYMINTYNVDVLFIPNCTYNIDHKYEDDRSAAEDIVGKMKNNDRAHQIKNKYNLFETLSLYPHIDLMFSNRRHPLIFAALHGISSIGCGEEWHIKPVLDELSIGKYFIDMENFNTITLENHLSEAWNDRKQNIKTINSSMPNLRQKALQHAKLAVDIIK